MAYRRLLLAAAAMVCAALTIPAPAWADPPSADAPDCSQRLYDPAGRLASDARLTSLRSEIGTLASTGAVVRVRVYDRLTASSIDEQERAAERSCPSWLNDGKRRLTLLVVAVAIDDRQTGIYYGADYDRALDDSWRGIQDDRMSPEFADGRYAAGLDSGLHAIQKRIEAAPPPRHGVSFAFIGVGALVLGAPIALVVVSLIRSRRRTGAVYTGSNSAASNFSSSSSSGDSGSSSSGGDSGGGGSSSW